MNALVTVIVPAYNRAGLIEETLESIRAQTYAPIEIVIVDDGSTDDTVVVVDHWVVLHPDLRATVHRSATNRGKSSSVNECVKHARGEFLIIFDSDDVMRPEMLQNEVMFLQRHPSVGMVSARAYLLEGGVRTSHVIEVFPGCGDFDDMKTVQGGDLLLKMNAIVASTVLIRRSVMDDIGEWNTALRYTHDWEYWIRVSEKYKIGFLAQPLIYYRLNSTGSSSANRTGTFREIVGLLMEGRRTRGRWRIVGALLRQVKFNALLAYHDGDVRSVFDILGGGMIACARCCLESA